MIFADILKHERVGPTLSSFFKFQSMCILAIRSQRQRSMSNYSLINNKTGPLFLEFNLCEDKY